MQRISTTVLGLVGSGEPARLRTIARRLGEHANVRAVLPPADDPALARALAAWSEAAGAHVPFVIHDADPLAEVAAAWVERWDAAIAGGDVGAGAVGRLEVAVQAVLQRWRAGSVELPDYLLVVDADRLGATERHWYLGVLAGAAPHRIIVVPDDTDALVHAVRGLGAGRWWPPLDRLLDGIDRRVPDQLTIAGADVAESTEQRGQG